MAHPSYVSSMPCACNQRNESNGHLVRRFVDCYQVHKNYLLACAYSRIYHRSMHELLELCQRAELTRRFPTTKRNARCVCFTWICTDQQAIQMRMARCALLGSHNEPQTTSYRSHRNPTFEGASAVAPGRDPIHFAEYK